MPDRVRGRSDESLVPVLISPREEKVVDGSAVAFRWNPAPLAQSYRLQISADSAFQDVLYDEQVGRITEATIEGVVPVDERTYFWRILALDDEGLVHGEDNIESFVSATHGEAAQHIKSPDQEEEFGPVGQLFRGAAAEVAAEVTGRPEYYEAERELGVEHEGIEAAEILGITAGIAAALIITIIALFQYVEVTAEATRFGAAGVSGYPEQREMELSATRQLTQFEVVDAENRIYRIPIDRAIDLMANEARQDTVRDYSPELRLGLDDRFRR